MSQTSDGLAFTAAIVYISADGSSWTDVSGHGASIAVEGGERAVGKQNTFDGDVPIIKAGDRDSVRVTCRYVYTEEDDDPFDVCRGQHETVGGAMYVQWAPAGSSGWWYKTGAGILKKPGYPGGEAGSGELIMSEFVVECAELTKADAST